MPAPLPSRVYLIPGLGGTELFRDAALTRKLFIDVPSLVYGGLRLMWLDATGYLPLPGTGQKCYRGGIVAASYGAPWSTLAADPLLSDWTVLQWPYDWRLPLPYQGQLLALDIMQRVTPAAPCTLVGHSNGGALARYAWAALKASGRSNLIRRIITLGTPHQGSYAALSGMNGSLGWLNQVLTYANAINVAAGGPFVSGNTGPYSNVELGQLQQSWVSWYDLLPNPFGTAFSGDLLLPKIFTGSNWPTWAVLNLAVLDDVFVDLLPAAVAPGNIPPPWVLTTVGGKGFSTPARISRLPLGGRVDDFSYSTDGDGTVMVASALVAGSYTVIMPYTHMDLVAASVAGGWLTAAILDPRGPPSPPPPTSLAGSGPATGAVLPALAPNVNQVANALQAVLRHGPDP